MIELKNILKGVEIISLEGRNNIIINGISDNSSKVDKGFLFFAVKGYKIDGHKFIEDAIAKGCIAIICTNRPTRLNENICYIVVENIRESIYQVSSNYYNNPSKKLKIIAVTGTNGKTSILYFLYQFFTLMGKNVGMISTIENKVGKKTISSNLTTQDPISLNSLLNQMVENKCEYCVMEASSHAIEQVRISGEDIYMAVFSNLSHDHLDYHKTFINYIDAKKKLFDNLDSNSFSIINSDDKRSKYLVQNSKSKMFTYGINTLSNYKAKIIENDINGLSLEIDNKTVNLQILGDFNAYNILSVYSVAKILNVENEKILKIISQIKTPKGRFEFVKGNNNVLGIVDYAHTPDALKNVLKTINNFKENKKLVTVFGAGGDRDETKRSEMGRIADIFSDYVIITSDNPRNENEDDIISDIEEGVSSSNYKILSNRKQAIIEACLNFNKESIILVAGKGHEQYQIINGKFIPHDDMKILKEQLKI